MKPRKTHMDIIKANRRGSREAEIEDSTGWKSVLRVHKTKKRYVRHQKHKGSGKNPDLFLCQELSGKPVDHAARFKCFSAIDPYLDLL